MATLEKKIIYFLKQCIFIFDYLILILRKYRDYVPWRNRPVNDSGIDSSSKSKKDRVRSIFFSWSPLDHSFLREDSCLYQVLHTEEDTQTLQHLAFPWKMWTIILSPLYVSLSFSHWYREIEYWFWPKCKERATDDLFLKVGLPVLLNFYLTVECAVKNLFLNVGLLNNYWCLTMNSVLLTIYLLN